LNFNSARFNSGGVRTGSARKEPPPPMRSAAG